MTQTKTYLLPRELTGLSLRENLKFLLKNKHVNDFHLLPLFSPPEERNVTVLDMTPVQRITPEGICFLSALFHWLELNSTDCHKVNLKPFESATNKESETNKRSDINSIFNKFYDKNFVLPCTTIEFNHPIEQRDASILQKADEITTKISEKMPQETLSHSVERTLATMLHETLLNVCDHAYVGLNTPPASNCAWVAAAIINLEDISVLPNHGYENSPGLLAHSRLPSEQRWLKNSIKLGAQAFLEVSVADSGIGIPTRLGQAHQESLKEGGGDAASVSYQKVTHRRRLSIVHHNILGYALSPFGTSKKPDEYRSVAIAEAWRGLYRVMYHAKSVNGELHASSGCAVHGRAFVDGEQTVIGELNSEHINDSGVLVPSKAYPGTTITLRIPLGIPSNCVIKNSAIGGLTLSKVEPIYIPYKGTTFSRKSISQFDEEKYVKELNVACTKRFRKLHEKYAEQIPFEKKIIPIVHPMNSLSSVSRLPCSSSSLAENEVVFEQAAKLVQIFRSMQCPDFIPLHLFLDIKDDVVNLGRDIFRSLSPSDLCQRPDIGVHGYVKPGTCEVIWFVAIGNNGEQNNSEDPISLNPKSNCMDELSQLYPDLLEETNDTRDGNNYKRIDLKRVFLPHKLLMKSLLLVLKDRVRQGAANDWHWIAPSGSPKEFLMTASGRFVTEYIGVHALVRSEPVAAVSLAGLFSNQLSQLSNKGIVYVVPDSETASFLLAKVLVTLGNMNKQVQILHPDDAIPDTLKSDCVFVFADVCFSGSRLIKRINQMRNAKLNLSIRAWVCFDARPDCEDISLGEHLGVETNVAFRWPLPEDTPINKIPKTALISVADPFTNEKLRPSEVQEFNLFCSLLWGNPQVNREVNQNDLAAKLDNIMPFEYGYQWIGNRFHVLHVPTRKFFEQHIGILAEWLLSISFANDSWCKNASWKESDDIVLFMRDGSPIVDFMFPLAKQLTRYIRQECPKWSGRIFGIKLASVMRAGRQYLRLTENPQLSNAVLLTDAIEYDHPFQIDMFNSSHVGNMPYHAFYVDSAVVSGRAIREFSHSMIKATENTPKSVNLCPILDKLSPIESTFLHHIPNLTMCNYDVEVEESTDLLPINFQALFQARIRSWADFRSTPLFTILTRLSDELKKAYGHIFTSVVDRIDQKISYLSSLPDDYCERYPLLDISYQSAPENISKDVVLFRHLFSLFQQGVPITDTLVNKFHYILEKKDFTLLNVFALEPDLLDEELLQKAFSVDIANLAILSLKESADIAVHSNALLVLFCLETPFKSKVQEIGEKCGKSDFLWELWVSLCVAVPDADERRHCLQDALKLLSHSVLGRTEQQKYETELILRGQITSIDAQPVKTIKTARQAIRDFFNDCRDQHGTEGFGCWLMIENTIQEGKINKSLDLSVWNAARRCLTTRFIPLLEAIRLLHHYEGYSAAPDILNAIRKLPTEFERASDIYMKCVEGNAEFVDVQNAWETLRCLTSNTTANKLMSIQRSAILHNDDPQNLSIIEYYLPIVVQDPLSVLWHTLIKQLGPSTECAFTATKGEQKFTCKNKLLLDPFNVSERWLSSESIPLVWHVGKGVVELFNCIVSDLERHADLSEPLNIISEENNEIVTLIIINKISKIKKPGRGMSLSRAEKLASDMQGHFKSNKEGADKYKMQLKLPKEDCPLIPLRNQGSHAKGVTS